jgi:hypothetical protein
MRRDTIQSCGHERALIEDIGDVTNNLYVVDTTNAGELLFRIWDEAKGFSGLPTCPLYLSTLDQCNNYIRQHPDLAPLLDVVHKKKAYSWFCESCTLPKRFRAVRLLIHPYKSHQ